jgi:trehalose 6-phosphate phosphatase
MHVGGPSPAGTRPPANLRAAECAFFLDLDGTLVTLAPSPGAVTVDPALPTLLAELAHRSDGALALVSGRRIATLDALLAPLRLPAAGVHGFERRDSAGGLTTRAPPERRVLDDVWWQLQRWVRAYPSLVLEDKVWALALHYRQAPRLESAVVNAMTAVAAHLPGLRIQRGNMVVELVPARVDKATVVAEFMCEPPFRGRRPVYAGDDLTDEPAFEWVNAAGGLSVAVGEAPQTAARTRLDTVAEVRAWLHALVAEAQ